MGSIVGKVPSKKVSDVSMYNQGTGEMCSFNECRTKFKGEFTEVTTHSKYFDAYFKHVGEAYVCGECGRQYVTKTVSNRNNEIGVMVERNVASGMPIEDAISGNHKVGYVDGDGDGDGDGEHEHDR